MRPKIGHMVPINGGKGENDRDQSNGHYARWVASYLTVGRLKV